MLREKRLTPPYNLPPREAFLFPFLLMFIVPVPLWRGLGKELYFLVMSKSRFFSSGVSPS